MSSTPCNYVICQNRWEDYKYECFVITRRCIRTGIYHTVKCQKLNRVSHNRCHPWMRESVPFIKIGGFVTTLPPQIWKSPHIFLRLSSRAWRSLSIPPSSAAVDAPVGCATLEGVACAGTADTLAGACTSCKWHTHSHCQNTSKATTRGRKKTQIVYNCERLVNTHNPFHRNKRKTVWQHFNRQQKSSQITEKQAGTIKQRTGEVHR
jgi:hypothetical protein